MAGHSLKVDDIPDPVFAAGLVGPGVAIRPEPGRQTAGAPISGRLVKLHPHAYVVVDETGQGVLVHLGIDTVRMQGDGFELLAEEGTTVAAGDAVVVWDPAYVEASGRSAVSAVVALDCDPAVVHHLPVDVDVSPGDLLLEVEC
jgi:PTS system N-acetylglucosamine-specific IIA component